MPVRLSPLDSASYNTSRFDKLSFEKLPHKPDALLHPGGEVLEYSSSGSFLDMHSRSSTFVIPGKHEVINYSMSYTAGMGDTRETWSRAKVSDALLRKASISVKPGDIKNALDFFKSDIAKEPRRYIEGWGLGDNELTPTIAKAKRAMEKAHAGSVYVVSVSIGEHSTYTLLQASKDAVRAQLFVDGVKVAAGKSAKANDYDVSFVRS
jgi:hypothetical protein